MLLSLETLTSIIRTSLPILVELINLVNSDVFLSQMFNFPTQISGCDSHSPALLDLLLSSDASICSTMAFPPLGNSDHVVVPVSIDFPSNSQRDAPFHSIAYDYSRTDWTVFMIICEMFHERISLNLVLLLVVVNFLVGFRLELMHISVTENVRSSLTHLHGFQLLCCCHNSWKPLFSLASKG